MFVVSILDEGSERNFVANDFRIFAREVVIVVGDKKHRFELDDLLGVITLDTAGRSNNVSSPRARKH